MDPDTLPEITVPPLAADDPHPPPSETAAPVQEFSGNLPSSEPSGGGLLDAILATAGSAEERSQAAQLVQSIRAHAKVAPKPTASGVRDTLKHWIAELDRKLAAQVNAILHEPSFQLLEGTWRGLEYLVRQTETGEGLRIRVLNVTKRELFRDLERAVEFDMSQLFKKIYTEEFGTLGGEPYGVVLGDYEFGRSPEDVALLTMIAGVAAAAHSPFIAAASPQMFNLESFSEMNHATNLDRIFSNTDFISWKAFRKSEDARYTALTLPRVLARLPYREGGIRCKGFYFEESVDGRGPERYCWMNAIWAYGVRIADAYNRYGWMARIRGLDGGGRVDDLPVSTFATESGDLAVKGPVEVDLSDRREFELSKAGFLALVHARNTPYAVFPGAQTCQEATVYHDANANANAELSTKLNYIMCVSRFAHFLKIMARFKIGTGTEADECERQLNDWIQKYVNPSPDMQGEEGQSQQPLREAKVEVRPIKARPGYYQTIIHLRPHYQLEAIDASVRLLATIPKA